VAAPQPAPAGRASADRDLFARLNVNPPTVTTHKPRAPHAVPPFPRGILEPDPRPSQRVQLHQISESSLDSWCSRRPRRRDGAPTLHRRCTADAPVLRHFHHPDGLGATVPQGGLSRRRAPRRPTPHASSAPGEHSEPSRSQPAVPGSAGVPDALVGRYPSIQTFRGEIFMAGVRPLCAQKTPSGIELRFKERLAILARCREGRCGSLSMTGRW
jgi:hypothetical protein